MFTNRAAPLLSGLIIQTDFMNYFAILGNHPKLSQAELAGILGSTNFQAQANVLFFSVDDTDPGALMNKLGGTIKIGEVYAQFDKNTALDQKIIQLIQNKCRTDRKIYFGLSAYNYRIDVKRVALGVKKILKEQGISCRWVQSRDQQLSSVIVKTNKLLSERGAEIVIIKIKDKLFLGRTLAVQAFDDFSRRDYGRPAADSTSGMIPPKLARMMINLAGVNEIATILDPFCGSGTILQEAVVLGYTNIFGSDISEKAVSNSQKNLEWLVSSGSEQRSVPRLVRQDVRRLSQSLSRSGDQLEQQINAIITEPYLGPPLRGSESHQKIKSIMSELEQLYLDTFKEFKKVLKPGGKVVIIFPAINEQRLQILDQINQLGFEQDQKFKNLYDAQARQSFLYSREGQRVKREIFVFKI